MATVRRGDSTLDPAEEHVRELRIALQNASEAIARLDENGRFLSANGALAALLAYDVEQLIGASWEGLFAPADRDRVAAALAERGERKIEVTARGVRRDGQLLHLTVGVVGVRDGQGRATGHFVFIRDQTERKRMEEQLILAGRMAAVGTLAAGVAHEINNPLAYIVANIDFTGKQLSAVAGQQQRRDDPATQARRAEESALRLQEIREALSEARQGAERVRNIVRDLKVFARGDDEAVGPVSLRRVLDSSINMAWNEIRHRARLVKDYGEVPPAEANESRLGQVFLNLLLNAAQAINEGEAERNEIRVSTRTSPQGEAVVEVRDTGHGIPGHVLPRIFDPFFTTKPVGVGTGLGLWICQGILTAYDGRITAESDGRGSVFRVTLPPVAADTSQAGTEPGTRAGAISKGRVLIVDDEPMFLGAIRRGLSSDYDVSCANDGREALERIKAGERFDIILCDLMMPELTGMDLHAELARLAPDQVERMIFVTGGAFTPRAREFLDRVPNARIEKPIESNTLQLIIRTLAR